MGDEQRGRCMTHDLWATLNQRWSSSSTRSRCKDLVDQQLAKGVSIEDSAVERAISTQPVVKPIKVNAPNSVFALSDAYSKCDAALRTTTPLTIPERLDEHDPAFPDLPGLRRDDAGRSARGRQDDPVAARAVRQPGVAQPRVRLGGGRGGREGARAGRRAGQRRSARDHLDLGRDRVEQPRDQGRGALLQDARASTSSR